MNLNGVVSMWKVCFISLSQSPQSSVSFSKFHENPMVSWIWHTFLHWFYYRHILCHYHFSCPPGSQNNEVQQVRELVDKATNIVMNYTETEAKVSKILWFVRLIPLNLKGSRSNKWRPLGPQWRSDARNCLLHICLRGFSWGCWDAVETTVTGQQAELASRLQVASPPRLSAEKWQWTGGHLRSGTHLWPQR